MSGPQNVVIGMLAHVDAGKTTLSEALLYTAGAIRSRGRVDRGDSFLDTYSLERSRGITIFSKQAVFRCGDTSFTLLDTPGHVDFSAETERTLQVLDYAVLVISAAEGVQSHTRTLWGLLRRYGVPCFLFVNKTDLPCPEPAGLLGALRERLDPGCVDFTDPASPAFAEEAALCDETLFSLYEETGAVPDDAVRAAIRARRIFPCFFGSALKLTGTEAFLRGLARFARAPAYPSEFSARVFKIAEDPQGARLTFIKVTGGVLRVRDVPRGANVAPGEKIAQIRIYSGEKYTAAEEAPAGTVCAVTGLRACRPGDGLGAAGAGVLPLLEPVLTYRVELPPGADVHTALRDLRTLEEEDPQLRVEWNETLRELRVRLMGEIQLEILQALLAERFGLQAGFGEGGVIYKETVAAPVEGVGHFEPLRHYAEVHLLIKPLPRGAGLRFGVSCPTDALDRNWQRLILTHLAEKTHVGVLTGAPVTDLEITLVSGRAHPKHTEGGDFRQATYRAVRQGLRMARSVLLEPYYAFTLEIPAENVGRALLDIERMGGSFSPPETVPEGCVIRGAAPVAAMRGYGREVVRYTRGVGRLSCAPDGYRECENAVAVIAAAGYDPDADLENPCDSVFCSHGAGYTVKWNEVYRHMHLPLASEKRPAPAAAPAQTRLRALRDRKDIFAADKELMQIFERTYGPVRRRAAEGDPDLFRVREHRAPAKEKPRPVVPPGPSWLLVDGYNVLYAWPELRGLLRDNLDAAKNTLINVLCNYQGYKKCEVILVFDAYKVKGHQEEVEREGTIHVVYTKEAETADAYIEKVSSELAKRYSVRVVTSDGMEQLIIFGSGALRVSAEEFLAEVRQAEAEIRALIAQSL